MGNALFKLWRMNEESNRARVDDKIESGKLLEEVIKEKDKIEKDYASLMNDVNKLFENTSKEVMKANYDMLTKEKREFDALEDELFNTKRDKTDLLKEVENLKCKLEALEAEREVLKEEKKKVEYMVYDLVKARDEDKTMKEKFVKIKAICNE